MKTKIYRFFIAAISLLIISAFNHANGQDQADSLPSAISKEKECRDKALFKVRSTYYRIVKLKNEYNDAVLDTDLEVLRKELRSIEDYCGESQRIDRIAADVEAVFSEYNDRIDAGKKRKEALQNSQVEGGEDPAASGTSLEKQVESYKMNVSLDLASGNYEGAAENCSRLIELLPNTSGLYWARGLMYTQLKKYPLAIKDYSTYIKLIDKDSVGRLTAAYLNRADCRSHLSDHYGAIDDLNMALELKPGSSDIHYQLAGEKLAINNYGEALKDADKALKYDPTNTKAVALRSEIKLNLGDYNGCLADCDKVLVINPYPDIYLVKGRALYKLGDKENACKNWSKAGALGVDEAYDYMTRYCK